MEIPLRVLVVEDLEDDALLLIRMLRRGGYDPIYKRVDTPSALRAALIQEKWDIVISDYSMPQFSGRDALILFKEVGPDIPFVIVSGTIGEAVAVEAMRLGAHDYLMKDNLTRLLPAIKRALQEADIRRARTRAEMALRHYAERLQILHEIDRAILAAQSTEEIAQVALHHIMQIVPCLAGGVVMFEAETREVVLVAGEIPDTMMIPIGARFPIEAWSGVEEFLLTLQRGEIIRYDETSTLVQISTDLQLPALKELGAILNVPLNLKQELVGFVSLGAVSGSVFDEDRVEVISEITTQLAIAISQARLQEQVKQHAGELEKRVNERTEQLIRANEQLKALSQMKDEFVSNVSHELRTPIANIKLHHYLLERNPVKRDVYMATLNRETDRLEDLVEGLLTLSRLDQKRETFSFSPTDLNRLVKECVTDRVQLAESKDITLTLQTQDVIPNTRSDWRLLAQVLNILLTNAFAYTPMGGSVMVHTWVRQSEDSQWVGFSVSDTGRGISSDDQQHLFERFFRGSASHEDNVPGTGLGLSIAKEIVDRHHGRIDVESEGSPGKGSTFMVWLPVDAA